MARMSCKCELAISTTLAHCQSQRVYSTKAARRSYHLTDDPQESVNLFLLH